MSFATGAGLIASVRLKYSLRERHAFLLLVVVLPSSALGGFETLTVLHKHNLTGGADAGMRYTEIISPCVVLWLFWP